MSSNLSDTSLTPEQVAARYLLGDPSFFEDEKDKLNNVDLMEQNKMTLPDRLIHKAESQYDTWKGEGYNPLTMDKTNQHFVPIMESTKQQLKHYLNIPNSFTIFIM